MLKQKSKRRVSQYLMAAAICLLTAQLMPAQSMADIGPPKGQVRIGTIHAIKPPKTEPKGIFMLVQTSGRDPDKLTLVPFAWGRPFSPARCYRCRTQLVALSPAQGQKLLGIIEKHPAFAKDHKVLKKLNTEAKLHWLSRASFRSLTDVAQSPKAKPLTKAIVDFFKKEKYASSPYFASRETVDKKHKDQVVFVAHTFEKINGQNIVLKELARRFRQDPGKRGMMAGRRYRQRKPIALARNPWFYVGILLLLGVVFFSTRRR